MRHKNITISDEEAEWIRKDHLNLSRFVQDKLQEEMKKRERRNMENFNNKATHGFCGKVASVEVELRSHPGAPALVFERVLRQVKRIEDRNSKGNPMWRRLE